MRIGLKLVDHGAHVGQDHDDDEDDGRHPKKHHHPEVENNRQDNHRQDGGAYNIMSIHYYSTGQGAEKCLKPEFV